MMALMAGRTALVTGGSPGIGEATALELSREGAAVGLVALPGQLERVAAACEALGARVAWHAADIGDVAAVAAAFDAVEARLGPVDAVFNNADISRVSSIMETSDAPWEALLRTNLSGNFYVTREAARRMVPRGTGAIVSSASELALMGEPGYAAYTATKGAILAMTRALAAELAPLGGEASIALGRLGDPAEIAAAVVFLLSDRSRYTTGTHLVVDGGRSNCFATGVLSAPTAA